MDAVASTSRPKSHDHIFEIATFPWRRYSSPSFSGADSDNTGAPTSRTKARSIRKPRDVGGFRWFNDKSVDFAVSPGSRRSYAAKRAIAVPRAPPSQPSRISPRGEQPEPNESSFRDKGGQALEIQELKRALANMKDEKQKVEQSIAAARTETERIKRTAQEENQKARRTAQEEIQEAKRTAQEEIQEATWTAQQEIERTKDVLDGLDKRQSDLKSLDKQLEAKQLRLRQKESEIDTTLAEGRKGAQVTADRQAEERLRNHWAAVHKEQKAVHKMKLLRERQQQESHKFSENSMADRMRHLKAQMERYQQDMNQIEEREHQRALTDALLRKETGRSNYDAYHAVWSNVRDSLTRQRQVRMLLGDILAQMRRIYAQWEDVENQFVVGRPEHLHKNYPELAGHLEQYFTLGRNRARELFESYDQDCNRLHYLDDELWIRGHMHRTLAKYHRFEDAPNDSDAIALLHDYDHNEVGNTMSRKQRELKVLSDRRATTQSSQRKEDLTHEIQSTADALDFSANLMTYLAKAKSVQRLTALKHVALHEKALFFDLMPAREAMRVVIRRMNDLIQKKPTDPEGSRSASDAYRDLDKRRAALKHEIDEVIPILRRKHLLEAHLDQSAADGRALDREFDTMIKRESEVANEVLLGMTRRRRASMRRIPSTHREQRQMISEERERQRKIAAPERPRSVGARSSGPLGQLEAHLEELNKQIAASLPGSEARKILQAERDRTKLAYQKLHRDKLVVKRADATSAAARAKHDYEVKRQEAAIANSEKALARTAHQVENGQSEQSASDESAGRTETEDQGQKPTVSTKPSSSFRRIATSRRELRAARRKAKQPTKQASHYLLPQAGQGHRHLNLQPTRPLQQVHVFMARLHQEDQWAAPPAQGTMSIAELADNLRSTGVSDVDSDASYEHGHVQSKDHPYDADHDLLADAENLPSDDEIASTLRLSDDEKLLPADDEMNLSDRAESLPSAMSDMERESSAQPASDTSSIIDKNMESHEGGRSAPVPSTPLDKHFEPSYRISPEDYRKAAIASPSTNAAFWSYKLYKNERGQNPTVHYCTTYEQAETQAKHFLDESVLGFDLEWEMNAWPFRASTKDCISLIQISSEHRIGLFQLALFKGETAEELLPPTLRTILESKSIAKTGVNVAGDAKRLEQCLKVRIGGYFELSHLYKVVKFSENQPRMVNRTLKNLAAQVQEILLLPLYKGQVRTSAWSRKLKPDQLEYAASDAYAGFQLYQALEAKRKKMDPMPPRPGLWEDDEPLALGNGEKITAQPYAAKPSAAKKTTVAAKKKPVTVDDDDDDDEFFEAMESYDTHDVGPSVTAGVPLAGIRVTYPSLPTLDSFEEKETAEPKQSKAAKPSSRSALPSSPEVDLAQQWTGAWMSSLAPGVKCRPSQLRAYHLWHHQNFNCREVARLLRKPPLSETTVVNYVLAVIQDNDLPYQSERARQAFELLPESARGRYWKVLRQLEEVRVGD
ncbi:uncharacterized protein LTR77_002384 [Saxophila tyrrhenica]|uniref:3'-5' exonuclease domain-containing protein n=1 Tax=Saxophila tyrrhenica TaxID=1690608 RepID=A0AAV9PJD7_9PEZI|nr:hypothetical protein LTR77_002384 [Saxophila tyrrhenica]